jgi:hypothetical protein
MVDGYAEATRILLVMKGRGLNTRVSRGPRHHLLFLSPGREFEAYQMNISILSVCFLL